MPRFREALPNSEYDLDWFINAIVFSEFQYAYEHCLTFSYSDDIPKLRNEEQCFFYNNAESGKVKTIVIDINDTDMPYKLAELLLSDLPIWISYAEASGETKFNDGYIREIVVRTSEIFISIYHYNYLRGCVEWMDDLHMHYVKDLVVALTPLKTRELHLKYGDSHLRKAVNSKDIKRIILEFTLKTNERYVEDLVSNIRALNYELLDIRPGYIVYPDINF